MGHQVQSSLVDLSCALRCCSSQLLKDREIKPEIDVSFPEALLLHRWHIEDRTVKDLARSSDINARLLLQSAIIEPEVVVERLGSEGLFKLMPASCQHDIFDLLSATKLLLKGHKLLRQRPRLLFGDVLKGILEQNFGPVVLSLPDLELRELDEELFVERALT